MFTLFDVIRNFGIVGGFVSIVIMGIAYGVIIFLIEGRMIQSSKAAKNWILMGLAAAILLPFPFISWGIGLVCPSDDSACFTALVGVSFLLLFIVHFIFVLLLSSDDTPCYIRRKKFLPKAGFVVVASFLWVASSHLFCSCQTKIQLLEPEQRINFLKKEISQGNRGTYATRALADCNDPDRQYFVVLGRINQGEGNLAGDSLKEYAFKEFAYEPENKKELYFWLGIANYLQRNYKLAAEKFQEAEESHLVLASLFAGGENLDRQTFLDLAKGPHSRVSLNEDLIGKIRSLYEDRWKSEREAVPQGDLALVLARLDEMDKRIQQGNSNNNADERKRANIQYRIWEPIEKAIYKNAPKIPETNYEPLLRNASILLYAAGFIFLLSMFVAIAILRDRADSTAIWRPMKKVFGKLSWHSSKAREISVRIALLEKEKIGVFSGEIQKIQQTSFPFDLILAAWYLKRAKKAAKIWSIASQEKEDLQYIVGEVRLLAGKLIPQGNEETLLVIKGLRDKAVEIFNGYQKTSRGYAPARESLLKIMSELATVGDILEARKGGGQITNYELLGVNQDAKESEIKKAYREIISVIHPDRNQGNLPIAALAAIVNTSYEMLKNPDRRRAYDMQMNF